MELEERNQEIKRRHDAGETYAALGRAYNLSCTRIVDICKRVGRRKDFKERLRLRGIIECPICQKHYIDPEEPYCFICKRKRDKYWESAYKGLVKVSKHLSDLSQFEPDASEMVKRILIMVKWFKDNIASGK